MAVVAFAFKEFVVTVLLPDAPVTAVAIDVVHPELLYSPKPFAEVASVNDNVTVGV